MLCARKTSTARRNKRQTASVLVLATLESSSGGCGCRVGAPGVFPGGRSGGPECPGSPVAQPGCRRVSVGGPGTEGKVVYYTRICNCLKTLKCPHPTLVPTLGHGREHWVKSSDTKKVSTTGPVHFAWDLG